MENGQKVYIGIDVSKKTLDIADGLAHYQIENEKKAIDKFIRSHYKHQKILICAEFTGPYHTTLAEVCSKKKITLYLCDGYKISHAKKGEGWRSKTDKGDADFLRMYLMTHELKPYDHPKNLSKIKELMNLQDLKIGHLRSLKNQCDSISSPNILKIVENDIRRVTLEIDNLQKKINALIDEDPKLAEKKKILCNVHGIGDKIATVIIVNLPEIGHLNRRQIAALCGLAPYNNESGKYAGHRCIKGGRSRVRQALFMAAIVSIKSPSFYTASYRKMVDEKKKPKKVALIMVARKLLCYLNSLMKRAQIDE